MVIGGGTAALVVSIWLGRRFLTGSSPLRERIVLTASMAPEEGYTGHPVSLRELVGRTATVASVLRPSGRVVLDGAYYEAVSLDGFYIGRGERVTVVRAEGGLLYCRMQESPDENAPEREEKR